MGYLEQGYQVDCITSDRYQSILEDFKKNHPHLALTFYFCRTNLSRPALRIPLLGDYLHYYIWLWNARPKVKALASLHAYDHAHHVTYSSIKFGTPLYDLPFPIYLGPLGGGSLPHGSLRKYLDKSIYFEKIKFAIGHILSLLNPSVKKSIQSASVILISNTIAENLVRRYYAGKIIRMFDAGLANQFELPFVSKSLDKPLQLLWIGRALPRKGLNLALQAIAALPASFPCHLTVVGDGPTLEACKQQALQLGINKSVTFTGKVAYDQLKPLYQQSHYLFFPSLIDSCPMQVFEAMAFGIPVISLDHQGMKDQIDASRGFKVPVATGVDYPKALAAAIEKAAQPDVPYAALRENAYRFGQQQLWKNRIPQFLTSILSV
jgi:glycosyltransferase involved in cell wall biosynthesis